MQIDLQPPLAITKITHGVSQLKFEREGNVAATVSPGLSPFPSGFSRLPPRSRKSVSTARNGSFERKFDGAALVAVAAI